MQVLVTGRPWVWEFYHPDGTRDLNELHGIAAVKAGLVAWVFMHLSGGSTTVRAIAVVIVLWVALLFSLTFVDRATRPEQPARAPKRSQWALKSDCGYPPK